MNNGPSMQEEINGQIGYNEHFKNSRVLQTFFHKRTVIIFVTAICSYVVIYNHNVVSSSLSIRNRDYVAVNPEIDKTTIPPKIPEVTAKLKVAPEPKRPPRVIALWSSWRSGTTFTTAMLASIFERTYYSYEPLHNRGVVHLNAGEDKAKSATQFLNRIYHCNFTNDQNYLNYMTKQKFYMDPNPYMVSQCERKYEKCRQADFVSGVCRNADLHMSKVLRLSLFMSEELLTDPTMDVRILLLVRDPRAVLRSRMEVGFCGQPACGNVKDVCRYLGEDFETAVRFKDLYPNKFLAVRYEDLTRNVSEHIKLLTDFFDLPMSDRLKDFIDKNTKKQEGGLFSTSRNTAEHTFAWRDRFGWSEVNRIQEHCSGVLDTLGLRVFKNQQEYNNKSVPVMVNKGAEFFSTIEER